MDIDKEQVEKELAALKEQLKDLVEKRNELDQAIQLISSYIKDIELKFNTYSRISEMSFQDIDNTLLKDS